MTGIQFVTDEKGRKTAVLIDLKKHKAISARLPPRLVQFAARSRTFMALLQDLIDGSQSYAGLAGAAVGTLTKSLGEIGGGVILEPLDSRL
jgi:hypothetical protein